MTGKTGIPENDAQRLQILHVLYDVVASALCEQQGHIWQNVPNNDHTLNLGRMERCRTCGETRFKSVTSSNTTTEFDFTTQGES